MKSLGKHLVVELYDCDTKIINSLSLVKKHLLEAVRISEATIVNPIFHKFSPHGVSGVVVIAESHFSIHTWPEYGYCALDIFTCGDTIKSEGALHYLRNAFNAKSLSVTEMKRGVLDLPVIKHK